MARYYIDADKLVAWCNRTFQAQSTTVGKAYVNEFLTAVFSCHVADVAPISDTVHKMQEAIRERCIAGGIYPAFVANVIDKVSKELLEDNLHGIIQQSNFNW